jgi:nitroimidazol reductase NimA-like FMN-containing flavoprotein (pyridoxamine 5'-phosphate oxidase superfamily)
VSGPARTDGTTGRSADRTRVRRLPEKQVRERAVLTAILDASLVAHVAVPQEHRLAVVPVGMARDGDRLLIHGSTASQAFRALAAGVPTCATVTLLDGVVVARSQFESSMHYRCAMVFGSFTELTGAGKEAGLATLAQHLLGGVTDARTPSAQELKATSVLALPLEEWSVKVSDAPPGDLEEDLDRPVWAGVVPLEFRYGTPVPAPDLRVAAAAPEGVRTWTAR